MATQQDRIRGYVGNLGIKAPVDLATTANITLSGEQTIDGTLTAESRVFVKDQTDAVTNGIYLTSSGAWTREPDFDSTYDVKRGTLIIVGGGTVNAGSMWRLTTASPVIGTSSLTFSLANIDATILYQTLTWAATLDWNMNLGGTANVVLTGNTTFAAPTNHEAGRAYTLFVRQDGTGSRTGTWNSVFKFPGGTDPVLSTGASAIDILSFISDGTSLYGVIQKAFA